MIQQVLDLCVTALDAVISWFEAIFVATGSGQLYLVIMCVVLTVSIMLGPLFGSHGSGLGFLGGSSDTASKKNQDKSTALTLIDD